MNAGRMLFALARHFDWWHNRLISEFEIDGSRADLVFVSKAGYATEIEIKVSRADWLRDARKPKWAVGGSSYVSRFFYAIPSSLLTEGLPLELDIPSFIPPHVGILVVQPGGKFHERGQGTVQAMDYVRERRAAKRLRAEKVPAEQLRKLDEAFYYRYWRLRMDVLRTRFGERVVA